MKLREMQECAVETLDYFIKVMPDAPFTADDVIIEFVAQSKMAKRAKTLCAQYIPDKVINDNQSRELNEGVSANALIGREKSAVIACIDHSLSRQDWRRIMFHEFTHIFCAKTEMDGEHFIDVYGSGTTPEKADMTSEERAYDGLLYMWSEFIAQYYALKKTEAGEHRTVDEIMPYVNDLLSQVTNDDIVGSKGMFAMACAYLLACDDADDVVTRLNNEPDNDNVATMAQEAFWNCLLFIHEHMQNDKPWKISESFIAKLGELCIMFRALNSFCFE